MIIKRFFKRGLYVGGGCVGGGGYETQCCLAVRAVYTLLIVT